MSMQSYTYCPKCGGFLTPNRANKLECLCGWPRESDLPNLGAAIALGERKADVSWRCFWCGYLFTNRGDAEVHFGPPHSGRSAPECLRMAQREAADWERRARKMRARCADAAQIFIIAKGDPCYDGKDVADCLRSLKVED